MSTSEERPKPDRREVERALTRAPHGIEVFDHDLALAGTKPTIDLVGEDPDGRLVLGLFVRGKGKDALSALRVVALARRHGAQLAEHVGRTLGDPTSDARVILIAERASRKLTELIAPLGVLGVELFEACTAQSRRGTRTFLVSPHASDRTVAAGGPVSEAPDDGPSSAVRDAGESELSSVVADLRRRIERIDDRVEGDRSTNALRWRLGVQELCALTLEGELPLGHLGEDEAVPIADSAAAEGFLVSVMERYLELSEGLPTAKDRITNRRLGGAPLLTPEEIDAFREPLPG
jgi:hypothetical protein